MENTFDYLDYQPGHNSTYYWDYADQQVIESVNVEHDSANFPLPHKWDLASGPIDITTPTASENLWDVATPRMLIMGKEKGGVEEIWAHPFMALRDYEAGIRFNPDDTVTWLTSLAPEIITQPSSFIRNYSIGKCLIKEVVTGSVNGPVGIVHYEVTADRTVELFLRFKSNLRLMWPYSEKVLTRMEYSWDKELNAFVINDGTVGLTSVIGANLLPVEIRAGQFQQIEIKGGEFETIPTDEFLVTGIMKFKLDMPGYLDVAIGASNEGTQAAADAYKNAIHDPCKVYQDMEAYIEQLFNKSLIVNTPNTDFNTGYRWALVGTDRFFVETPGIGGSLVAGYATTRYGWDGAHRINGRPGYAWYFGRDGQWSGMALLDYGDFEKVKQMLEVYQRFQDLNGKIFHELSTSGVVHYDAADATPLYIILAGRYLRHSGNLEFIRSIWPNIRKAIEFCFSTDTDDDHLIENTDVGHGWVEGGGLYGTHSTLYLVSCWAEALREASYMAALLEKNDEAERYQKESQEVVRIINTDFMNPETGFFNDGLYRDGSYLSEPTIQASIPLYFRQTANENAAPMLQAFAGNGFSSDWGTRIISSESRFFNPRGYHTGSVWPLFTGWTALAEYRYGGYIQGYSHIMNNLQIYHHWSKGFIEEVLHGLEYRPSGVCAHQCWSETMVLQPVIEGMLGLECDALQKRIKLAPGFPFDWDSVSVQHIRLGDCFIDFSFAKSGNKSLYLFIKDGPGPITVDFNPLFPPGWQLKQIKPGKGGLGHKLEMIRQGVRIHTEFSLADSCLIEIEGEKGISILPLVTNPSPGDHSEGFRIISTELKDHTYKVTLEGPSGKTGFFNLLVTGFQIISTSNIISIEKKGEVFQIGVNFESSYDTYGRKEISLEIR
jgi:glycogen debranching enzyme